VIEIFSDYECPVCAMLNEQTIPLLLSQYVATGKVRLLHRDYPLPQHTYARLAARYANAAGRLGYYKQVVDYLFQTQNTWVADGNVDRQVAQILAPGVMQKVRDIVKTDVTLDDTVAADVAVGMQDAINRTPTLVIVSKGKRQQLSGVPDPGLLQTYLDGLK
jgi:protein-disulfide isomerase